MAGGPCVLGVRGGRQREDDAEDGAAPGPRAVADGASVGLDYRADDRQAEPDTALAAGPRAVGAVEALEDPVGLLGRHAGARIRDLEHDLLVLSRKPDVDGCPGRSVNARVRE